MSSMGGTAIVVELSGEIDLSRKAELDGYIEKYRLCTRRHVVIDASELTFCDSTGLGFLVRLLDIAQDRDGDVTLLNTPDRLRHLLKTTNLEERFRYEERVHLPRRRKARSPSAWPEGPMPWPQ
jgi:anti-sigma B factor antagonist